MKLSVKVSNNKLTIILLTFVIFITFLGILSIFRSDTIVIDKYEDAVLPLIPLNSICSRNLAFKTYPNLQYSASVRSAADNNRYFKISCPVKNSRDEVNEDYNIIVENGILYGLFNTCISLDFADYALDASTGKVTFNFKNATQYDFTALTMMFLLNPLYVEFNGSEPYYPIYRTTNTFTNIKTNDFDFAYIKQYQNSTISLQFSKVLPTANTVTNVTFPKESKPLASVIDNSLKHTPMKLYYLDQLPNQQSTGRAMKLRYDSDNNRAIIYQNDYSLKYDVNSNEFNFMNKLFILYVNKLFPVLTFSFTLTMTDILLSSLKKSEKTEFMNLYMDTERIGYMRSCNYNMLNSQKINNMVSAWVELNPTVKSSFRIVFSTPQGQMCSQDPFDPNNLQIELPFMDSVNDKFRVIITVTPYEKIALVLWDKYFIFRRTGTCVKTNNFVTLWSQNEKNMNNIYLRYNPEAVKDLTDVTLGYVNFLKYM